MATGVHRLEVIVELGPLHEPISGRVIDNQGRRRSFSGWLDLMDILDRARHHNDLDPTDDTTRQSGGTR
jgi:hypothetical protein